MRPFGPLQLLRVVGIGYGGWCSGLSPSQRRSHLSPGDPSLETLRSALIQRLSAVYTAGDVRVLLSAAGTGGAAADMLLGTPGASASLVELALPYSRAATTHWISDAASGWTAPLASDFQFSSAAAAQLLAQTALHKALRHEMAAAEGPRRTTVEDLATRAGRDMPVVLGLGAAASLASSRPKKGPHEAFVAAAWLAEGALHSQRWHLRLDKDARSRAEEELLVGCLILRSFLERSGHHEGHTDLAAEFAAALRDGDALEEDAEATQPWQGVQDTLALRASHALLLPGKLEPLDLGPMPLPRRSLVFPGSFNPLHVGHVSMARAAQRRWEAEDGEVLPLVYEITALNPDKGAIPDDELRRRCRQFCAERPEAGDASGPQACSTRAPVLVTSAALFSRKAELFPGSVFLIGADTAARIVDPKYYGNDHENMVAALALLHAKDCAFVVGGRVKADGSFQVSDDVLDEARLPAHLRAMFLTLREEEFRVDLSSTELRKRFGPGS